MDNLLLRSFSKEEALQMFVVVVHDSFDRLLFPSVEKRSTKYFNGQGRRGSNIVFRENLKNLL